MTAKSLTLDITGNCNLACNFCYNELDGTELNLEQINDIIVENSSAKIIEIGGGEPFLHNNLVDVIDNIVSVGKQVNITTNGTMIPDDILNLDDNVKDYVKMMVSLHASTSEKYEMITGVDCFDIVVKNIQTLNEIYKTTINSAIYEENFDQVEGLIQLGYELQVPVRINLVYPVGKGKDVRLLNKNQVHELTNMLLLEKIQGERIVDSPLIHLYQNNCPVLGKAYGFEITGECPTNAGQKIYYNSGGIKSKCEFMEE